MDKPNIKLKNSKGRLSSPDIIANIQKKILSSSKNIPKKERIKKSQFKNKIIFFSINVVFLVILAIFLITNVSNANNINSNPSSQNTGLVSSPLDQVASANIALTVARVTNLPETTSITNQADSQNAEIAMAATTNNVISKPQITTTALKSRADIVSYKVQTGDTVASLAQKFGVTSNSIEWSNNLSSNSLIPGQTLLIPPVNGIVYIVKSGDTVSSLAQKYNASAAQIIAYNDAELKGIWPGEKIIIPNGNIAQQTSYNASYAWSGPSYGYNGYDYGYCTWYVASKIAVPTNWGNAITWAYYAALSGWNVSSRPTVGAIAQTPYAFGGEGHVAMVDAVSSDGTMIKFSDMNGLAGWGRVGYSGWVPASSFPNYITK